MGERHLPPACRAQLKKEQKKRGKKNKNRNDSEQWRKKHSGKHEKDSSSSSSSSSSPPPPPPPPPPLSVFPRRRYSTCSDSRDIVWPFFPFLSCTWDHGDGVPRLAVIEFAKPKTFSSRPRGRNIKSETTLVLKREHGNRREKRNRGRDETEKRHMFTKGKRRRGKQRTCKEQGKEEQQSTGTKSQITASRGVSTVNSRERDRREKMEEG